MRLSYFSFMLAASLCATTKYTVEDLGPLDGPNARSYAGAINSANELVVVSAGRLSGRSFLYANGALQELGNLRDARIGFTYARALNNLGKIVGEANSLGFVDYHAFLYEGTKLKDLGTLGGRNSGAWGVNDVGQVVGISETSTLGTNRAFLYESGVMKELSSPGVETSFAGAVNNRGQIVGHASFGGTPVHAFRYSDGVILDLGTLGGTVSYGFCINESGQVGGYSSLASGEQHGFVWSQGLMKDIGSLGGSMSGVLGINNMGQAVGFSRLADNITEHAFIYDGGGATDLNDLITPGTWTITIAYGINDLGQIAAQGTSRSGQTKALLLKPVL